MKTLRSMFLLLGLLLAGCGLTSDAAPREPIPVSTVKEDQAHCEQLAAAHSEFWTSHDMDVFDRVYTEGIIHDDGGTYIEGRQAVAGMARQVVTFFPALQAKVAKLYIAGDQCLGVYEYSPLSIGGYDFTQDDPLIEIDWLRGQGDQIAYWGLFEDQATVKKQRQDPDYLQSLEEDTNLLNAYAAAWSSGKVKQVADLYAADAIREDAIFNQVQSGLQEIRTFTKTYFQQNPGVRWQVENVFGNVLSGERVSGGLLSVQLEDQAGEVCEIGAAVLLAWSEQNIAREAIFYDADSLVNCGWAQ